MLVELSPKGLWTICGVREWSISEICANVDSNL